MARRETQAERRILVTISCVGSRRQSGAGDVSETAPDSCGSFMLVCERLRRFPMQAHDRWLDVGNPGVAIVAGGVVILLRAVIGALGVAQAS